MRIVRPTQAVVPVALVLALVGCNTTQPDREPTRTASLVLSTTAKVDFRNCYQVWEDTTRPPDGIPDVNTGITVCDPSLGKVQANVPWHYSLSISLIRAGTTTEEIVASSVQPQDGIPDFISMTEYDITESAALPKAPEDTFYFLNGKQVSHGNRIYLGAIGLDLGEPNVLGHEGPPTFLFNVNSGDTVVVRARKQAVADAPPFINFDQPPEIELDAVLAVSGVVVATTGTSTSSFDDKAGFSFSFTVQ